MMGALWMAWGADGARARRCREAARRAGGGKMLWVEDRSAAERMLSCAVHAGDEVHLLVCDGADGLDAMAGLVAQMPNVDMVVLTEASDPERVLELFRLGVREVIADEVPVAAGDSAGEVRVESAPERSPVAGALQADSSRQPEPWRQPAMQRYVADLDEPDVAAIWQGEMPSEPDAGEPQAVSMARGEQPSASPVTSSFPSVPGEVPGAAPAASSGGAPVVVAVSGYGGCGKSTVVAAMALIAAQGGLRTAVLDLDLMFGRLYIQLGAESAHDLGCLIDRATQGPLDEDEVVRASTRIAPGLTLWGPLDQPERAELMGPVVERLLEVLRAESDIVLVDTSTFWGDAVAAAVAACDRCMVVADARPGSAAASVRVIDLVARLGVPRTRMMGVFNRCDGREATEDAASRFAFTVALSAQERVADGGREVAEMAEIGRLETLCQGSGAFAASVRKMTSRLAMELGHPLDAVAAEAAGALGDMQRRRIRLPWKRAEG